MPCEGKYNIKAVSKILGIQSGTLRAWERRYSIVEPYRNEAGHRLYSDDQVYLLKWLVKKVNQGFTISQAIEVAQNGEVVKGSTFNNMERPDSASELSDEILEALLSFDEKRALDLISQAFSMYNLEKVIIDILGTLLVQLGHMWEQKKISVAHEHYASAFLRTKIGQLIQSLPIDPHSPKIIVSCGLHEEHEIGLLIFTLFLRQKGFNVIYLGSGIPKEDFEQVLDEVEPKLVFFSCTIVPYTIETLKWVKELSDKYQASSIGVGGSAIAQIERSVQDVYQQFIIGNSKNEWEEWISKRLNG